MKIGENIRSLRKQLDITQEQLAFAVGVTCQAVSKWENDITLPDITMIPVLAEYFGISTDALLAFDRTKIECDVEKIAAEAFTYREKAPERSRDIIEAGLRKYPGNEYLLNELLYVLDYSKNPDEVIKVAERLTAVHVKPEIRYNAFRFIAYACDAKGDTDAAVAAMENVPQLYFTRLSEMAFVAKGEVKWKAADTQRWISFETLLQMQAKMAECCNEAGDNDGAADHINRALKLIAAMEGEERLTDFEIYREYFEKLGGKT